MSKNVTTLVEITWQAVIEGYDKKATYAGYGELK